MHAGDGMLVDGGVGMGIHMRIYNKINNQVNSLHYTMILFTKIIKSTVLLSEETLSPPTESVDFFCLTNIFNPVALNK